MSNHASSSCITTNNTVPDDTASVADFWIDSIAHPGQDSYSSAQRIGQLLSQQLAADPHFYLFSPDETTSNKLSAAYQASARAWALPTSDWDLPSSPDGRIIELLSENVLFSTMIGHILSGESAIMASYESFFEIIASQLIQHLKFLKQSSAAKWRPAYPAVNLLSTSTCWRQDHNGFSHQSPALISTLLAYPGGRVNCLFPVDDVSATEAFRFMLDSTNVVNLTTFNKTSEPRWIDSNHAQFQYANGGASTYEFASDPGDPDLIFTAAGDIATKETLYAMQILREELPPEVKMRFVGINALSHNAIGTCDSPLTTDKFNDLFTASKPIIANFHGYPEVLRSIFSHYCDLSRLMCHGFIEEGSTTTPFEMLSLNHASRYDLCISAALRLGRTDLAEEYRKQLLQNESYTRRHGIDMPAITEYRFITE